MQDSTIESKFNLGDISEVFPNEQRSSNFRIYLSDLPSIIDFKDHKYFNNYIKSIILPDMSVQMYSDEFSGWTINHPINKSNADQSDIQLTFRVSEDLKNYLLFMDYIRRLKYGDVPDGSDSNLLSKFYIKSLNVDVLDNQKRSICTLSFLDAFPVNLSSLGLQMGESEVIDFTVNFKYRKTSYITHSIFGS